MIIIGYQGIGKSSLAGRRSEYIDLESSNFNNVYGEKTEGWHIPYCKVAEDLSKQGYVVFVSCHPPVQNYFEESNEYVMLIYPSLDLKEDWINRLSCRYEKDRSVKNLTALNNADLHYDKQIMALNCSPFENKLVLKDMNYILDDEITNFFIKGNH